MSIIFYYSYTYGIMKENSRTEVKFNVVGFMACYSRLHNTAS